LRGLVAAALLAWTLGLLCGALSLADYGTLVGNTLVVGVFMVVCGIACSLYCTTATRAMTFVIVIWLSAAATTAVAAGIVAGVLAMIASMAWLAWTLWTGAFQSTTMAGGPPLFAWIGVIYVVGRLLLYGLAALVVAGYCRRHFDRLAGRSFPETPARSRLRNWSVTRKKRELHDHPKPLFGA
jgi:hypothetical protein